MFSIKTYRNRKNSQENLSGRLSWCWFGCGSVAMAVLRRIQHCRLIVVGLLWSHYLTRQFCVHPQPLCPLPWWSVKEWMQKTGCPIFWHCSLVLFCRLLCFYSCFAFDSCAKGKCTWHHSLLDHGFCRYGHVFWRVLSQSRRQRGCRSMPLAGRSVKASVHFCCLSHLRFDARGCKNNGKTQPQWRRCSLIGHHIHHPSQAPWRRPDWIPPVTLTALWLPSWMGSRLHSRTMKEDFSVHILAPI